MLFNSIEFLIFLPLVYILYRFVFNKSLKLQNIFMLCVSYIFYGWWDWRFLILILISSLADYSIGLYLGKTDNKKSRKQLRNLSILINLGILGSFKYFNFFTDSFIDLFNTLGLNVDYPTLKIILPVGISFYTFQTLGYTIDVYKKKIDPEKDLINFMLYVCFFPQLVAGPIERAGNLLPQIRKKRIVTYEDSKDGIRMILLGFFKKVVIADNLGIAVNYIYSDYADQSPITLILGAAFFTIQMYCDFAGYSEIAVGIAKLFGFKLIRNFKYPFYVANGQQFWTKWHISLTIWFRDYLLLSLKSSFKNKFRFSINYLITLTIIGFWHGANWTFIAFGFINGLYILPVIFSQKLKKSKISTERLFPSVKEFLQMAFFFSYAIIPAGFFRSPDIGYALDYWKRVITNINVAHGIPEIVQANIFWFLLPLVGEWFVRNRLHALDIGHVPKAIRWFIYILMIIVIINYGNFNNEQFIYFQF